MTIYHRFIESNVIPWRIRSRVEMWVEAGFRRKNPRLYDLLHLGRTRDGLQAVTHRPHHHFFGYYDKSPWDASGRFLLAHRASFNDRAPTSADELTIGVVDLQDDNKYVPLGSTLAWNWQQGAMMQWRPQNTGLEFSYNDRRDGQFVGVIHRLGSAQHRVLDRPIYCFVPNTKYAMSLNFARLADHRPGYGYAGVSDKSSGERQPLNDGIWRVDLESGALDLLVSIDQLATQDPKPSMRGAWHYVNHIQPSRSGARIAFFHIWHADQKSWEVRLYSCRPDGTELRCLLDTGLISHYDWRDDDTILVWANQYSGSPRFLLLSHGDGEPRVFADNTVRQDGHCTFSPDGRWVLNDTYPDRHEMRNLMLLNAASAMRIDLARLYSPKSRWGGEIRCDLHPRWSRDGKRVCIDSVHDGSRQMYVMDVSRWTE